MYLYAIILKVVNMKDPKNNLFKTSENGIYKCVNGLSVSLY